MVMKKYFDMIEREVEKTTNDFRIQLKEFCLPEEWANKLWALNQAVSGQGSEFILEINKFINKNKKKSWIDEDIDISSLIE